MKKNYILLIAFLLFVQTHATSFASFSDIPDNYKYKSDIQFLEQTGVLQGSEFKPEEPVTREVFAKWVLQNAGFSAETYKPKTTARFSDVRVKGNQYSPYIYKLLDLGAIKTEDRKFHPKDSINRKDAISWLFQVEGIPVPLVFDENRFKATDVKINNELAPLINKAISLGLVSPGITSPYRKVKRGEAAHYLKTVKITGGNLTVTIVPAVESSDMVRNPKFDIMTGAWSRIFSTYLKRDSLSRDKLIYGAIEGMVKELGDKHSDFERPGDNALLESLSGEIEGIGAVIQEKDGEIVIVSPIIGSPADRAGLLPSDIIVMVDDVAVKGMKLADVVAKIKGPKGTKVKMTIKREDKTLTFNITRDVVKIVSAKSELTEDGIAKIMIANFGETTTAEFATAIKDFDKNPPKGIVMDLRSNPGGFLNIALQIGGYFVKSGDEIASVRYPDRETAEISDGTGELAKYKVVVLINKGSASASEILAGALQDFGIAKIIGEQSYGKGTVQELSDFPDGSTLKLTVAEWLTPNGRSIEKNGITPDIEVKLTAEDRAAERDPQMDKALAELRK